MVAGARVDARRRVAPRDRLRRHRRGCPRPRPPRPGGAGPTRSGAAPIGCPVGAQLDGAGRDRPRRRADGVERDELARPTGRLFRLDGWLGTRSPVGPSPTWRPSVPTWSPAASPASPMRPRRATWPTSTCSRGRSRRRAADLGGRHRGSRPRRGRAPHPLTVGPVKVVIADHDLPPLDQVESWFRAAHVAGRNVAVHCVTDIALVLALAAWDAVGARPGDRVEHGSVVHPVHRDRLHRLGLTVVTQPGFVHRSGDRYLAEVDAHDLPYLYPCASLLGAGVEVGGSSDAAVRADRPVAGDGDRGRPAQPHRAGGRPGRAGGAPPGARSVPRPPRSPRWPTPRPRSRWPGRSLPARSAARSRPRRPRRGRCRGHVRRRQRRPPRLRRDGSLRRRRPRPRQPVPGTARRCPEGCHRPGAGGSAPTRRRSRPRPHRG